MRPRCKNKLFYESLIVVQCIIFGLSFIALQELIESGYPIFAIVSLRFFIGAISLLSFCAVSFKSSIFSIKRTKDSTITGIISGTVMFLAFSLQTFGAKYTTPANNALCTGLYVIFVPLLGIVHFRRKNAFYFAAALVSFLGVALVSGFSLKNYSMQTINVGDVLSILCGLFFAIHFIVLEKYTAQGNLPYFTIIQLFTVATISFLVSLFTEKNSFASVQWGISFGWIVFLGVLSTAVTYMIQSIVQSRISAEIVSVISCSESLFAVIFSLVLGYSIITIELMAGAALILITMVAVALYSSRQSLTPK